MKNLPRLLCLVLVMGFSLGMDCQGGGAGSLLPQLTLNLTIEGQGRVEMIGPDGNTTFSSDIFGAGTEVTLQAVPALGWLFEGWEGDVTQPDAMITVVVDSEKNLKAVFIQEFTLTTSVDGDGSIEVVDVDGGVGSDDSHYRDGSVVSLVAMPASGWVFMGWSGDVSATDPNAMVTMDLDKAVTAKFVALAGIRTVTVNGVTGRMTLALKGDQIRGNCRKGSIGGDIIGTITGNQVMLTSSSPGFRDSFISATLQQDGSLTGTIDGSGFSNDPFTGHPVSTAWTDHESAGRRNTSLNTLSGLLTTVITGNTILGTWRTDSIISQGWDIDGTISGDNVFFTATSQGFDSFTINATIQADNSWVGTANGSGFVDDPFEAQPSLFP